MEDLFFKNVAMRVWWTEISGDMKTWDQKYRLLLDPKLDKKIPV